MSLSPTDFTDKLARLQLICFDVDGVLTDGRLYYSESGDEMKSFNVQDGAAIKLLMQANVQVALITGRRSKIVARRAAELGIDHVYQGIADKTEALADLMAATGIDAQHIAHVGDDLPDVPVFKLVGLGISVDNGHPLARAAADFTTASGGGDGVARELSQHILTAKKAWPPKLG